MSTRLYLSSQPALFTPATIRGAWNTTGQAVIKALTATKGDTVYTDQQVDDDDPDTAWDMLAYRGVYGPLTAQTIAGTLNGCIVAMQGQFADAAMFWHVHVYVTVGQTDVVRGTLLSDYRENSPSAPFPVSSLWGGFALASQALSSVAAQAGDCLVVEIGAVARNAHDDTFPYYARIGYGALNDSPDATPGLDHDELPSSWIEFSTLTGAPVVLTPPAAFSGLELIIPRVRLIYEDVDGNPETHLWSPLPIGPIGAETQYTEERAVEIGDLVYALSDREGRLQATSALAVIADKLTDTATPLARSWLARQTGKTLRGREIWIELNSDKGIYRGDAWWVAFRGFIERFGAGPQFRFRFEALGWIFKRLKEQVLTRTVSEIFPGAPVDSRQRLLPLALGLLSDEPSATAAPVFVDDEAGRGGGEVNGDFTSSYGDIATPPTGAAAVEAAGMGNLNLGDQPGDEYFIQWTRIVAGVQSDPDPFLPNALSVVITNDGAAIDATCDNDGADAYRCYIGREYPPGRIGFSHYLETTDPVTGVRFTDMPALELQALTPITTAGVLAENPFAYVAVLAVMADGRTVLSAIGFAHSSGYRRPTRFSWTAVVGALSYEAYWRQHPTLPFERRFAIPTTQVNGNGDPYWEYDWGSSGFTFVDGAPQSIGVVPPILIGPLTDNEGHVWPAGFLISARPGVEFLGGQVGEEKFTAAHYAVSVAAPGLGLWNTAFGPNEYITVGGLNLMIVALRGPLAARVLGYDPDDPNVAIPQERFGVNVRGVNAAGNTVTAPEVTDIYDLLAILADNGLLADSLNLIASGAFVSTPPTFSDGTSRRDLASFLQAKADAAAVITGGNTAGRWLASPMSWAQLFMEWCPSAFAKIGINPDGSMRIVVTNPNAAAVARATELTDILRDSFSFMDTDQGYGNIQPYSYGQSYSAAGVLSLPDEATEADTTAQTRNDEQLEAPALALPWRTSAVIARQIARAYLRESAYLPRTGPMDHAMPWVERKVGELVEIEHREGTGSTGWTDRKVQVLGLRISPMALRVGVTWLDLRASTSQLSLFLTEELMSTTFVGGDRHRSLVTFGSVTVPINWIKFQVNWDDVPSTHGIRLRVEVATEVGTIKPTVFLFGENPGADTAVVEGVTESANDMENQEQTLVIPRDSGLVEYWLLPVLAGGATADRARMLGVREAYRV